MSDRRRGGGAVWLWAWLLAPGGLAAQQVVTNTAVATFQTPIGLDSAVSNRVQTTVVRPVATLQISVVGAATAHPGDTLQYRIVYGNTSSLAAITGTVLTDTLPAGLEFASALPAPAVTGGGGDGCSSGRWAISLLPVAEKYCSGFPWRGACETLSGFATRRPSPR